MSYQIATGIGTWGLNRTVGWAFDITNFVFWVGIGHAGTLISAILFLFRQKWRTAVNRSAEAMTIFAVMCAGLFPIIHMGRPWLFYWMFPYPNTRGSLWVNFTSALAWDFFAISTYFLISLTFWYVGLLPDLATVRDRAKPGWRRRLLAFFSLGWNGSYRTWHRYEIVYLLLAGLATPLVVSVHSIVSSDFATSVLPGWHATIFPPYFVAGAIFSGMAMVLTLMLIARKVMHLEDYITPRHVDAMGKIVLATSCMVGLAYAIEFFTALQSPNSLRVFHLPEPGSRTARLGLLDHGGVQCAAAAAVVVPPLSRPSCSRSGCCRFSSTWACGLSVSSSSPVRWSATSCRRVGPAMRRR